MSNYEAVRGRNAGESEANGLFVGLAQWSDRGDVDISAKARRFEELHRGLGRAISIARTERHSSHDERLWRDALGRDGERIGERLRVFNAVLGEP